MINLGQLTATALETTRSQWADMRSTLTTQMVFCRNHTDGNMHTLMDVKQTNVTD